MIKKIFIYLTAFICITDANALSQRGVFVKDTVYVFICRTGSENEMPQVAYILYKSLDSLPDLAAIDEQQNAVCAFFKHCVWFEEPFFTLNNYIQSYGFDSNQKQDSVLTALSKKITKLSSRYTVLHSKKFTGGKDLQIECAKLTGEFWIVDGNRHDINSLDHSIKVETGCYNRLYWYNLKDIAQTQKISKKETLYIQQRIGQ